MTTETPTLNNAQRDGIRALREAAFELAAILEAESAGVIVDEAIRLSARERVFRGSQLAEPESREHLESIIVWADRKLKIGGSITLNHAPALRRLLDDATALLRWVDGAL